MSASRLVKVPDEISFEQAATSMIQGLTAHYLVHTTGRVEPGDKVLIHAISGGTGSLVCQVAKNRGKKQHQVCKLEIFGGTSFMGLLSCKNSKTVSLPSTLQVTLSEGSS